MDPTRASASQPRFPIFFITGALFVLIALIAGGYWWWMHKYAPSRDTDIALGIKSRIEFVGDGASHWFELQNNSLRPVRGPEEFDNAPFTVLETIPSDKEGSVFALIQTESQKSTVAGRLRTADMSILPVVSDASMKSSLAFRKDGYLVYTALIPLPTIMVRHVLEADGSPVAVGAGRSTRVDAVGRVLALSSQGVVLVDPLMARMETLFEHANADGPGGAISRDGSVLALPGATTGSIEFYSLNGQVPSLLGTIDTPGITDGTFESNTSYVARMGSSAKRFTVPTTP